MIKKNVTYYGGEGLELNQDGNPQKSLLTERQPSKYINSHDQQKIKVI